MARQPSRRSARRSVRPLAAGEPVGAADFKARCLELMDRVRETGAEFVVTKHGEPVAKLVPYSPPKGGTLFGALKGSVLGYDGPFEPVDGEWDIERNGG